MQSFFALLQSPTALKNFSVNRPSASFLFPRIPNREQALQRFCQDALIYAFFRNIPDRCIYTLLFRIFCPLCQRLFLRREILLFLKALSLVLTGYERVENKTNKEGVGSATNSLFGGTATAEKLRNVLVIILTPVVLESPLVPESRMRHI